MDSMPGFRLQRGGSICPHGEQKASGRSCSPTQSSRCGPRGGWRVCSGSITEEKGEGCPGPRTHLSSHAAEPWGGRDGATGRQEGCRGALLPKQLQEGTWGSQESRHRGSARVNPGNSLSKHTHCAPSTGSQPCQAGRARSAAGMVPQPLSKPRHPSTSSACRVLLRSRYSASRRKREEGVNEKPRTAAGTASAAVSPLRSGVGAGPRAPAPHLQVSNIYI